MPTPACPKCNDARWYCYTTRGTPHMQPCEVCCKHEGARWLLTEHYGENNGKWCCRAGCGKTWDKERDDEDQEWV